MFEFLLGPVVGAAVALGGIAAIGRRQRGPATGLRRVRRTPLAEFPTAAPAKAVGVIGLHHAVTESPLSGRRCIGFAVIVEEQRGAGALARRLPVGQWCGGVAFALSDDTGTALVEPRRGVFAMAYDTRANSSPVSPPNERQQAILERLGLKAKSGRYHKWYRFSEGIVEVGDSVAVYGPPTRSEPDRNASMVAGGYRDGPSTRLTIQSNLEHKVVVSSLARDMKR